MTNENPRTIGGFGWLLKHSRFSMHIKKRINLLVLKVNDLVLLEVNAEIAKLSICWLSGRFFMKALSIFIGFSAFLMRMAPIMIGNCTFYTQN